MNVRFLPDLTQAPTAARDPATPIDPSQGVVQGGAHLGGVVGAVEGRPTRRRDADSFELRTFIDGRVPCLLRNARGGCLGRCAKGGWSGIKGGRPTTHTPPCGWATMVCALAAQTRAFCPAEFSPAPWIFPQARQRVQGSGQLVTRAADAGTTRAAPQEKRRKALVFFAFARSVGTRDFALIDLLLPVRHEQAGFWCGNCPRRPHKRCVRRGGRGPFLARPPVAHSGGGAFV